MSASLTVQRPASSADMSRRKLMSGITGGAFVGAAVMLGAPGDPDPEHPDAELLALLAKFDALERYMWPPGDPGCDTIEEEEARDALAAPFVAEQEAMLDRIFALRATTPAGWQARARTLILWDKEMPKAIAAGDNPNGYLDDRMMLALLRDMVGEEGLKLA